jgi:hypothetical protein
MSKIITKTSPALLSIREVWGTREGTNLEKVIAFLLAHKGKAVLLSDVAKAVYKSGTRQNMMKVKAVTVGLNMTIDAYGLPYAHVVFEGRGDEATVTLASKAKKATKADA